jgi:hypothetical protein
MAGNPRMACAVLSFSRAVESDSPQRQDSHSAQLGKLHLAQPKRSSNAVSPKYEFNTGILISIIGVFQLIFSAL